jgi:hypothetical protein
VLISYYKPVSRILFLSPSPSSGGKVVIIYLSSTLLLGSICLPISIGRAALIRHLPERWPMWHFSMQGLPAVNVTITSRELLPHVFIFSTDKSMVVIFCGTICYRHFVSTHTRLFTGALLYAVRTFLLILQWSDNPACSNNFKEATAKIITLACIEHHNRKMNKPDCGCHYLFQSRVWRNHDAPESFLANAP